MSFLLLHAFVTPNPTHFSLLFFSLFPLPIQQIKDRPFCRFERYLKIYRFVACTRRESNPRHLLKQSSELTTRPTKLGSTEYLLFLPKFHHKLQRNFLLSTPPPKFHIDTYFILLKFKWLKTIQKYYKLQSFLY